MSALSFNADGSWIFVALENSSGHQVIAKAAKTDLSTWSSAYAPGAGSAANVIAVPSDSDLMLFYGNFGTDVVLIKHTISTGTNTDISPASLGTKISNTCAVDPNDADRIVISVDTDQDVLYTEDGGTTWTTVEATLAFNATALAVLWNAAAWVAFRALIAGNDGVNEDLLYTPNAFGSEEDVAGTLSTVANIVSIEVVI